MLSTPFNPKGKRILLVNDDGISAPGLQVLETIARKFSDDIWIFAPETECSGASHSLTLNGTIRLEKISRKKYSVKGTPTDCVLIAISEIMKESQPDLILSGVNSGLNIADDITYSGTASAAMEGAMLGFPSIALSQQSDCGKKTNWSVAQRFGPEIITSLLSVRWRRNVFMNINFPYSLGNDVLDIKAARQGQRSKAYEIIQIPDPRKNILYMIGNPRAGKSLGRHDADDKMLGRGAISVTPLQVNMTHSEMLRDLKFLFSKG